MNDRMRLLIIASQAPIVARIPGWTGDLLAAAYIGILIVIFIGRIRRRHGQSEKK